jgi:hypothetical protein
VIVAAQISLTIAQSLSWLRDCASSFSPSSIYITIGSQMASLAISWARLMGKITVTIRRPSYRLKVIARLMVTAMAFCSNLPQCRDVGTFIRYDHRSGLKRLDLRNRRARPAAREGTYRAGRSSSFRVACDASLRSTIYDHWRSEARCLAKLIFCELFVRRLVIIARKLPD